MRRREKEDPVPEDVVRSLGLERESRNGHEANGGSGNGSGGSGTPPTPSSNYSANAPDNCTDLGNARRFVSLHGTDIRYCYERDKWLYFDGRRWRWDTTGEIERRAKDVVAAIAAEAQNERDADERKRLLRWALSTERSGAQKALVELARSEPGIPVTLADLDRDDYLLNLENGTLDLRIFELREHRRNDLITRYVDLSYDPDAGCPLFQRFLERIQPSTEIRAWLQEYAGYALTGDTRERVLAIFHGNRGKNGKSTLVETLRKVCGGQGGYALTTPPETLLAKPSGGVPNDVARLAGVRFVSAAETERGQRLAEGLIKQMTGGEDTISARFMRAEWFDFKPTHKIFLSTNNKPVVKGTDEAIWDRVRLVPFIERIPPSEQDKKLPKKLEDELPGILAWAVEGCRRWQEHGLSEPAEIMAATRDYRTEMDVLGEFLAERCVVHPRAEVGSGALYAAYREWCADAGEDPITQTAFATDLKDRGVDNSRRFSSGPERGKKKWSGIGLRSPEDGPDGGRGNNPDEPGRPPDSGAPSAEPADPFSGPKRAGREGPGAETHPSNGVQGTNEGGKGSTTLHAFEDSGPTLHTPDSAFPCVESPFNDAMREECEGNLGINGTDEDFRENMAKKGSHPSRLHAHNAYEGRSDSGNEALLELTEEPEEDVPRTLEGPVADADEGVPEALEKFLADPPGWWRTQAAVALKQGCPERLLKPLASATASEALGNTRRHAEALPAVREKLREMDAEGG